MNSVQITRFDVTYNLTDRANIVCSVIRATLLNRFHQDNLSSVRNVKINVHKVNLSTQYEKKFEIYLYKYN